MIYSNYVLPSTRAISIPSALNPFSVPCWPKTVPTNSYGKRSTPSSSGQEPPFFKEQLPLAFRSCCVTLPRMCWTLKFLSDLDHSHSTTAHFSAIFLLLISQLFSSSHFSLWLPFLPAPSSVIAPPGVGGSERCVPRPTLTGSFGIRRAPINRPHQSGPTALLSSPRRAPVLGDGLEALHSAKGSEFQKDMDGVPRRELGTVYTGLHRFQKTFFGSVPELDGASEAVFGRCLAGENPLFDGRWMDWPANATESRVARFLINIVEELDILASEYKTATISRRVPKSVSSTPILGSKAERKVDYAFVYQFGPPAESRLRWSQILVLGELKMNLEADDSSQPRLDLARYAREVFIAQDNRRFVLSFTLCGSLMNLCEIDRLGEIASKSEW